jgi:acyl carrier protein
MNTLDTIREMIAEREGIDINLIKPETTLEELNIDSLELFDLLFEVEKKFNIHVPNIDIEVKDIKGVAILIETYRK